MHRNYDIISRCAPPFSSVSHGHSSVLCGLHDLFSLFSIVSLRFAEPPFRILLCFLFILSCFFFSFFSILCVFTLNSQFVHNLFIINCYTVFKLREQPLNNKNAFTTHIDKFFHNSLGVPGTSGHSSFYGKYPSLNIERPEVGTSGLFLLPLSRHPHIHKHPSGDVVRRHGSEASGILGIFPVVTQHEIAVCGNRIGIGNVLRQGLGFADSRNRRETAL